MATSSTSRDLPCPSTKGMLTEGFAGRGRGSEAPKELMARLRRLVTNTTSIAVVGSSGNLRYRRRGPAIDAHDVIVRVNNAPTVGYEDDVGGETTIRFAWGGGMEEARKDGLLPHASILVARGYAWDRAMRNARFDLYSIHNRWVTDLHRTLLRSRANEPSTGFDALAFAMALACEVGAPPVSVFGFGRCAPCAKYYSCSRHYGQDAEADGSDQAQHPFGEEASVRRAWSRRNVIRLFEEECDGYNFPPLGPAPPSPPLPPLPPPEPPLPPPEPPLAPPPRPPLPPSSRPPSPLSSPPPPLWPPPSPPLRPPPSPPPPFPSPILLPPPPPPLAPPLVTPPLDQPSSSLAPLNPPPHDYDASFVPTSSPPPAVTSSVTGRVAVRAGEVSSPSNLTLPAIVLVSISVLVLVRRLSASYRRMGSSKPGGRIRLRTTETDSEADGAELTREIKEEALAPPSMIIQEYEL